jgi:hypothetical protein
VEGVLQHATLSLAPGEFMMLTDWCSHPPGRKGARLSMVSRPARVGRGADWGRIAALATPWTPPGCPQVREPVCRRRWGTKRRSATVYE